MLLNFFGRFAAIGLLVLTACGGFNPTEPQAAPASDLEIYLQTWNGLGTDSEILRVDQSGTVTHHVKRTMTEGVINGFDVSAGRRLVFSVQGTGGASGSYLMIQNAAGSYTFTGRSAANPRWSGDGSQVTFDYGGTVGTYNAAAAAFRLLTGRPQGCGDLKSEPCLIGTFAPVFVGGKLYAYREYIETPAGKEGIWRARTFLRLLPDQTDLVKLPVNPGGLYHFTPERADHLRNWLVATRWVPADYVGQVRRVSLWDTSVDQEISLDRVIDGSFPATCGGYIAVVPNETTPVVVFYEVPSGRPVGTVVVKQSIGRIRGMACHGTPKFE